MVAELDNGTVLWTLRGIGQRLECNSVVTKVLHAIVLKTPSRLEDYACVVDWIQWPGVPILAGGPAVDQMPGPVDHRHRRLEDDGGRYSKDTTQDCLETQAKFACFEAYNRSLSEELKARAKAVISEKTGDVEFRDNRSVLSSHGGLAGELIKSENSIELAQIASRVDSAIHGEISNGDDSFVKVKGFISDMNTSWKRGVRRCYSQGYFKCLYSGTQDRWAEDYRQACSQCLPIVFISVLKEAGVKSTATPERSLSCSSTSRQRPR